MATHSSILIWKISWTDKSGSIQHMRPQRVKHDCMIDREMDLGIQPCQIYILKSWLKLSIQKTKIMASGPSPSWQIDGENMETVLDFIFLGSKISKDSDCSHKIKRHLLLRRIVMTNLEEWIKKQRHHFANKGPYSQSYGFSSSHLWMWELDYK